MSYNFLDDFYRLNDNIKKYGTNKGFERTMQENKTAQRTTQTTPPPPNPRPLSNQEIKQAFTKRKIKVNPFE
jgi:hypothetical protein